mgnify:FL=1
MYRGDLDFFARSRLRAEDEAEWRALWTGPDLPFVKATDTRFWNGVNWFLFEEEDAQDLYPVPESNKQDLFIWHKSAVGWAAHTDIQMREQWHNEDDWWSINMKAKGAATLLQEGKGVKRFRTASNGAIAIV